MGTFLISLDIPGDYRLTLVKLRLYTGPTRGPLPPRVPRLPARARKPGVALWSFHSRSRPGSLMDSTKPIISLTRTALSGETNALAASPRLAVLPLILALMLKPIQLAQEFRTLLKPIPGSLGQS